MSYTYVIMDVSPSTFDEIRAKLLAAGYGHALDKGGSLLDMHGMALRASSSGDGEARD